MSASPPPAELAASYFDGRSARAVPVRLRLADGALHIEGPGVSRREAFANVQWPERTRHGARIAHLADGASLHAPDALAWDRWMRAGGHTESAVVRAQQSWRWVIASLALFVAVMAAGYHWGLPAAARTVVALTPPSVDAAIGREALKSIDAQLFRPSRLPAEQQQRIRAALQRAVAALPAAQRPVHELHFRAGGRAGPNAFALPGGAIVLTDELVALVDGDLDVITGVLAHELGHVRHRHGLRMLVQVTALGAAASVVIGDFSSVLAALPVLLGQSGYSRDAEREADREAVQVLRAAGISPAVMVRFFERISAWREGKTGRKGGSEEPSLLGISISSHPADAERIRFFREAGAR